MEKFNTTLRVRYEETDQMKVVYYSKYLVWFEVARTEYLRNLGISYKELEKRGLFLVVAEANCLYKSPARYDDLLEIETEVYGIKNTSLSFKYQVKRDSELIAEGSTAHVFVNENGKPTRIPEELKRLLLK